MRKWFIPFLFSSILLFSFHINAQTLNPPNIKWGPGNIGNVNPTPQQQIGYDSVTGNACIVGSTATCSLQTINSPNTSASGASTYSSTAALATSKIVKNGPGNLYSFQVGADNTLSAAAWWVMMFDEVAAPADGPVTPAKCYPFPAGTTGFSGSFDTPVRFNTGIVIAVSTTGCFSKTSSTHAFISGDYK